VFLSLSHSLSLSFSLSLSHTLTSHATPHRSLARHPLHSPPTPTPTPSIPRAPLQVVSKVAVRGYLEGRRVAGSRVARVTQRARLRPEPRSACVSSVPACVLFGTNGEYVCCGFRRRMAARKTGSATSSAHTHAYTHTLSLSLSMSQGDVDPGLPEQHHRRR
jgi:hypothetical protein